MDDETLARRAVAKQHQGSRPTRREAAALRRVKRQAEKQLRAKHYASVPKKLWVEWSGRQYKQLAELAARYGVPLSGRTIDLPEFVAWFHDWLARVGPRVLAESEPEPTALERKREEDWRIRRLERERLEGDLAPMGTLKKLIAAFARHIRRAIEILQRRFGEEAAEVVRDALTDAHREVQNSSLDIAADGDQFPR